MTDEILYSIIGVVNSKYGTKFEAIESGTIYAMEQQLKIIKPDGTYDYPALDKDSFNEKFRRLK